MFALMILAGVLPGSADPVPAAKNVTAGWVAFGLFAGLAIAVALLGFSLVRHLRKARENADRGVFGPEDVERVDPRHLPGREA
jgi:hypothetical protein